MSIDAYLVQAETRRATVAASDLAHAAAVAEHRRMTGRTSLRTRLFAAQPTASTADEGARLAPLGVLAADA